MAINVKRQIGYWLTTAESDFESAKLILDKGKNLHWCLFLCHLVIEKHLKALVVQHTKRVAPKIHDLEYLAELAGLELPVKELDFLTEMNVFNLEARYPDEQLRIYKKATPTLARKLFQRTKEFTSWAKGLVKQ